MMPTLRRCTSLVAGCLTAVALAITATLLARTVWPAYASAEPTKAYSLSMLVVRLSVGALCTAGAAWVTTLVARDTGTAAWWLGAFFLALSLPDHLVRVWADYPPWYHVVYLAYLVPIAGCAGQVTSRYARGRDAGSDERSPP
jgi:hypothetical protein